MLYQFYKINNSLKLLCLLCFLFYNHNVLSKDLFDSFFVNIIFESNNIEETKKNKIEELKINNLNKLFKNILTNADYKKIRNNIDLSFTDKFVKNIIIENENIINNSYSADIKINYDTNLIIKFLRNNKFSYVDYLPESFFIIILEKNDLKTNLFSRENSFYKYLLNNPNIQPYYILPNLDLNDRYLLSKDDINNRNVVNINKIINKYNHDNILIIDSVYNNIFYELKSYLYLDNEFYLIDDIKLNKINYNKFYLNLKINAIDIWKTQNSIQNNQLNNIKCNVKSLNIYELKEINKLINSVSVIHSYDLQEISLYSNLYSISFYGNHKIFKKLLDLNSIKIDFVEDVCNVGLK